MCVQLELLKISLSVCRSGLLLPIAILFASKASVERITPDHSKPEAQRCDQGVENECHQQSRNNPRQRESENHPRSKDRREPPRSDKSDRYCDNRRRNARDYKRQASTRHELPSRQNGQDESANERKLAELACRWR